MSVSSVQKLVESGVLPGWRTQGGHRRIPMEAIKRELAKSRDAHAPAPAQVLRVLVVEDNAVICAAYAKMILQWGGLVEVSYAADGAQAHEAAQRRYMRGITAQILERVLPAGERDSAAAASSEGRNTSFRHDGMALPPDRIHFYIQVSDGATWHASAGRGHFMRACPPPPSALPNLAAVAHLNR
jgi:excisionase family DNA binding protein